VDSNRRLVDGIRLNSFYFNLRLKPGNSPHVWNDWRTL
jgi:hypothetical protein